MNKDIAFGLKRSKKKRLIQQVMDKAGRSQASLARSIGISRAVVCKTINGLGHNAAVLDALRAIGVPEKYLFDPRRREAA